MHDASGRAGTGLVIVGLGPGDPGQMSRAAWDYLEAAESVLLRTRIHPTVGFLEERGISFDSCDDLYEDSQSFEEIYSRIANRVIDRLQDGRQLVFAVPGHPLLGEQAVALVRRRAAEAGIPVTVVPSPGFLDAVLPAVGLDVGSGVSVLDAGSPEPPSPGIPTVYYQVYDRLTASELKLTLLDRIAPGTEIWHVQAAGTVSETATSVPLYQLDHLEFDHLTSVVVPAHESSGDSASNASSFDGIDEEAADRELTECNEHGFDRLVEIMRRLRGPGGCPWDREQTPATLARYVLEEAYEVVDCIDRADIKELPGELGDLLLQVVFHAQIAAEDAEFDIQDVIDSICDKLIRRHPHVFGDVTVSDAGEVVRNWEAIKLEERAGAGREATSLRPSTESLLSGVPVTLPAVSRADKLFRKAARVGFDWPDSNGPLDKAEEELKEVREALAGGSPTDVAAEVGDLFLAVINTARKLDLDPETVTRDALQRFIHRFEEMERLAGKNGRGLELMNPDEQDALWVAAKLALSEKRG